ncbi:hypothetical protein [Fischerella major]|uniref:hypothetical protein n=1 Tax=Fischerella major TaxID=210993 RepID=UPI000ACCCB3D
MDTGIVPDERLYLLEETGGDEVLSAIIPLEMDCLSVAEFLVLKEFLWNQLRFVKTSDLRATAIIFWEIYLCE